MKIKRFEASSMSNALRMIKKEFGEEAVILSAKSMKKASRLLSGKSAKQVIVTAAIDTSPAAGNDKDAAEFKRGIGSGAPENMDSKDDSGGGLTFLKRFKPITRTGQRKLQPKLVRMMSQHETSAEPYRPGLEKALVAQGVDEHLAADLHRKTISLASGGAHGPDEMRFALSQVIAAGKVVGPETQETTDSQRIVVLVGAAGVGKTTTVAKFAARHTMQFGNRSVALFSLDDQRIAGRVELERYARILGIELRSAFEIEDIKREFSALQDHRLVIVDTPGMSSCDHVRLERLRRSIGAIPKASVYLVLNADADGAALDKAVRFFNPLDARRLVFTKLDWASRFGGLINLPLQQGIPVSHLCDSQQVPEGMRPATADAVASLVLPDGGEGQADDPVITVVGGSTQQPPETYYVANRNSDIFHHKTCKSIQRINRDNRVVFNDPAEAMGQHFKPCRMCCGELIISKPVQRLARHYASNR
jgi:flagellar biosynthesis protein FlhF